MTLASLSPPQAHGERAVGPAPAVPGRTAGGQPGGGAAAGGGKGGGGGRGRWGQHGLCPRAAALHGETHRAGEDAVCVCVCVCLLSR